MKNLNTLIFLLFISLGCQSNNPDSTIKTISIDLTQEKSDINLTDLIKPDVDIIPLENYDQTGNPIYFRDIHKFRHYKNEFYMLDFIYGQRILVFNNNGEFQRAVGHLEEGPGGLLQAMDFDIINDTIKVLDVGRILNFEPNGNYISLDKMEGFMASKFIKFEIGYAFIGGGRDTDNLILANNEIRQESSFFPYHTRALNVLLINPMYYSPEGDAIYRRQLNDTLFQINDFERPSPYLYIDFKQKKSNINELLNSPNPEAAIVNAGTQYCEIHDFYETKEYQYLAFSVEGEAWVYLQSKKSEKSFLYKRNNITNDIMLDPYAFPVGVIGNKFVFKANPQNVLAGIESYQGTNNHFEKLKKLWANMEKEGNPVLFLVEFNF
ncbi:6-bladed beta-propeller protein [Belliella buryatensis]|uniref:6-bladed beta-propeller protein n=1 Tax=Belliella buryatensis TaxID=1500549 RepID=A0A239E5G4_9BACT|nr:6-bladed beta-propeller [Belliella buryatensis]SNS39172.1 6-bladed beta-propeller protein [Belliella buryatensis]